MQCFLIYLIFSFTIAYTIDTYEKDNLLPIFSSLLQVNRKSYRHTHNNFLRGTLPPPFYHYFIYPSIPKIVLFYLGGLLYISVILFSTFWFISVSLNTPVIKLVKKDMQCKIDIFNEYIQNIIDYFRKISSNFVNSIKNVTINLKKKSINEKSSLLISPIPSPSLPDEGGYTSCLSRVKIFKTESNIRVSLPRQKTTSIINQSFKQKSNFIDQVVEKTQSKRSGLKEPMSFIQEHRAVLLAHRHQKRPITNRIIRIDENKLPIV